ncbi:MAG: YidC/Oxa1 family membrane protein insertase [Patescibacteria group bacterium]|nr:YidC/Oxa1 family membrane protein insertase [Patescibacteria group bacterium]
MLSTIFTAIFFQPIFNIIALIYNYMPNHEISLVIIVFVILINLALWPLGKKMLQSQKQMQDLQPRLDELKKTHKDNQQAYSQAVMALYKDEKINPFSGCLIMLIQLPFFWAIFQVLRDGFSGKGHTNLLYPFISDPGTFNTLAFGFFDFTKPNLILAIVVAALQFVKAKMMPVKQPAVSGEGSKDESMAAMMNKQMLYMGPIITFIACVSFPSGLSFYWLFFTLFSIVQQWYVFKKSKKDTNITTPSKSDVIEGEIAK